MRISKFLIPNYDYQRFVMTLINVHYISICDPTMPSTSKAPKKKHVEIAPHVVPTKLRGSHDLLIA
jgi:hypothetical protein